MNYVFAMFESVHSGLRKLGSLLLFIIVNSWKGYKCLSVEDWLNYKCLWDGMPGKYIPGSNRMIDSYILT